MPGAYNRLGPAAPHVSKPIAKNRDGQLVCVNCGVVIGLTAECLKPDQENESALRNNMRYRAPWTL